MDRKGHSNQADQSIYVIREMKIRRRARRLYFRNVNSIITCLSFPRAVCIVSNKIILVNPIRRVFDRFDRFPLGTSPTKRKINNKLACKNRGGGGSRGFCCKKEKHDSVRRFVCVGAKQFIYNEIINLKYIMLESKAGRATATCGGFSDFRARADARTDARNGANGRGKQK